MTTAARIADLEIHPAAQMFPEMEQEDLNKLYESVKKNGVQKPIILYDGKLLDGRNRVRAALIGGIPFKQLPKVNLPLETDPYQFAWMMNCERLDYQKHQKAEIKTRIDKESGLLQERKKDKQEKRLANLRFRHVAESKETEESREDRKTDTEKTDPRKNSTAARMATEAGVSQRTMERVMGRISNGGSKRAPLPKKQASPSNWSVPRHIGKLAAFLVQKLPSDEIEKLWILLGKALQPEAAA